MSFSSSRLSSRSADASSTNRPGRPLPHFNLSVASEAAHYVNPEPVNDPEGKFVRSVPAGTVSVVVDAPAYMKYTRVITVEAKNPTTVDVALLKGRRVFGRVADASGHAVGGAQISIEDDSAQEASQSDEEGEYELRSVPAGEVTIGFRKNGFVSAVRKLAAGTGDHQLDATLTTGRKAAGRVIDRNGAGVAGANVMASSQAHGTDMQTATTEKDGSFVVEGLVPARYNFTASGTAGTHATLNDVDITRADPIILTIGPKETGTIRGTLAGYEKGGWMAAMVMANGDNGNAYAQVGRDGRFTVENVPAGSVEVMAMLTGQQRESS